MKKSFSLFLILFVAGFGAVKVTQNIRAEAERQLDVQNKITGEINKQLLAGIELKRQFAEQEANAARADNFSRSLGKQ